MFIDVVNCLIQRFTAMQKSFFYVPLSKSSSLLTQLSKLLLILFFSSSMMSFKKDSFSPNNPTGNDGDKDSTKGFRTLLGNNTYNVNGSIHFDLNPKVIPFVDD